MASNEIITVDWQGVSDVIIETLEDAAIDSFKDAAKTGLNDLVANTFKNVVEKGADIAKVATIDALTGTIETAAVSLILEQVLGIQDSQQKLLESIQRDVKALIKGPYNTGVEYLKEAAEQGKRLQGMQLNVDGQKRITECFEQLNSSIMNAKAAFMDALGNEADLDHFREALIRYNIGICWLLLGDQEDTKRWLEQSYACALGVLEETWKSLGKPNIFEKASAVDTAAAVGSIVGIAFAFYTVPAAALSLKVSNHTRQEEFEKRGKPIYMFIQSLRSLKERCPQLALQFEEVSSQLATSPSVSTKSLIQSLLPRNTKKSDQEKP